MSVDATQPYDDNNIFARLLRGEIPSTRVYEDEHTVVFRDIAPWAPTHLLAVPRGAYVSWDDFSDVDELPLDRTTAIAKELAPNIPPRRGRQKNG